MGSSRDEEFTRPIRSTLENLGISFDLRISSAHKTPHRLIEILHKYERSKDRLVYITVAGRSNALSGLVDANSRYPVIACLLQSEKFGGADIYSSLRMPSGVSPLIILEPANAALAAAKILALSNSELCEKVINYQQSMKSKIERDDARARKSNEDENAIN